MAVTVLEPETRWQQPEPADAARVLTLSRRSFVIAGGLIGLAAAGLGRLGWDVASPASPGRLAAATTFGSVEVVRAERQARLAGHGARVAGHRSHGTSSPQPFNHTWGDAVALVVVLHNAGDENVLFSPGQVRLRVGAPAVSVTPWDAAPGPEVLEAGRSARLSLTYLTPSDAATLSAEFTEASGGVVPLQLPGVAMRPGALEQAHG